MYDATETVTADTSVDTASETSIVEIGIATVDAGSTSAAPCISIISSSESSSKDFPTNCSVVFNFSFLLFRFFYIRPVCRYFISMDKNSINITKE